MIIRCKDCGRSSYRKNKDELCGLCKGKSTNKHTEAIDLINKAMNKLGNSNVANEARKSLRIALNKLSAGTKGNNRTHAEQMHQTGVNMHEAWWSKIEDAVRQSSPQESTENNEQNPK
jgi:ribosomal protein L37E